MEALEMDYEETLQQRPQGKASEGPRELFRTPCREQGLATPILCVDDHDSCCNLFDILSDLGYQVDVAYNTADALNSLSMQDYCHGSIRFRRAGSGRRCTLQADE